MQLCAAGRLDPLPLVSHVLRPTEAAEAYALLDAAAARLLQVMLDFRRRDGRETMRHPVRLAVQEQYLRGDDHDEKWEHAQRLGFDAIELRGAGDGRFAARLPELRAAAAAGRADADGVRRHAPLRRRLRRRPAARRAGPDEVPAVRHGRDRRPAGHDAGVVRDVQPPAAAVRAAAVRRPRTPRSCSTRSAQLAAHAEAEGVVIALEPLNRYEDHMVNTLGQARRAVRADRLAGTSASRPTPTT